MKTAMHVLLGIILIITTFSFVLVYINTHPPRYPLHIPPSVFKADYEDLSFTTEDGIRLEGWLVKPAQGNRSSPAIILCHGVGANKSDFTELAVYLAQQGYYTLLFDFRAHGNSGGGRTSLGYHEQKDVLAALNYLRTRTEINSKRIGIFGFSLGGSTAILTAAHHGGFRAVVADSAFASLKDQARTAITVFYHLPVFPFLQLTVLGYELSFQTGVGKVSPVRAVEKLAHIPILIIAGDGDKLIPADNGRKLYAAAKEPKEIWIIPGADHGGTIAAAEEKYYRRVGEFFDRYLK